MNTCVREGQAVFVSQRVTYRIGEGGIYIKWCDWLIDWLIDWLTPTLALFYHCLKLNYKKHHLKATVKKTQKWSYNNKSAWWCQDSPAPHKVLMIISRTKEIIGIRYEKKAFMLINGLYLISICDIWINISLFLLYNHKILVIYDTLSNYNLI